MLFKHEEYAATCLNVGSLLQPMYSNILYLPGSNPPHAIFVSRLDGLVVIGFDNILGRLLTMMPSSSATGASTPLLVSTVSSFPRDRASLQPLASNPFPQYPANVAPPV